MLNWASSRLLQGQGFRDLTDVPEDPVGLPFDFHSLMKNYDFFTHPSPLPGTVLGTGRGARACGRRARGARPGTGRGTGRRRGAEGRPAGTGRREASRGQSGLGSASGASGRCVGFDGGRAKGTIFQNALRHFILLSTSWPAIKKKIQGIIKSKIQQSIRFFLTKSVLRRNYLELNLLGSNQGLTDLGERKYLTPVPPSNPLT